MGVVHKDIKCPNIRVSRKNERIHLTLLDFGLAERLGDNFLSKVSEPLCDARRYRTHSFLVVQGRNLTVPISGGATWTRSQLRRRPLGGSPLYIPLVSPEMVSLIFIPIRPLTRMTRVAITTRFMEAELRDKKELQKACLRIWDQMDEVLFSVDADDGGKDISGSDRHRVSDSPPQSMGLFPK